jgi:methylmalonyl-CoA mutase N-terminal domain/subunit
MEQLAEEEFARIERRGSGGMLEGVLAGIDAGYFQQEIAESAFLEQQRYEKGRLTKVGVTDFVEHDEPPIDVLVIGPEVEREQAMRVADLRAERDADTARAALTRLTEAARGDDNLVEPLVDCARAMCTEGEIVSALREVFGSYEETPRF